MRMENEPQKRFQIFVNSEGSDNYNYNSSSNSKSTYNYSNNEN